MSFWTNHTSPDIGVFLFASRLLEVLNLSTTLNVWNKLGYNIHMNPFENISAENLHHAYLVVGRTGAERPAAEIARPFGSGLFDFLTSLTSTANPDVQRIVCDTLTIDLARKIAVDGSRKSFDGGKKFFLIETNIITEEAQNALLKIFEEPNPGTHFFVIMPQDILLPTLRSRMQVIREKGALPLGETEEGHLSLMSRLTLDMKIADRLVIVKEITDGISDEEKTKQDAVALLNEIENELYQSGVEKEANNLLLCQKARASLYDRGAPVKMILENLMLAID